MNLVRYSRRFLDTVCSSEFKGYFNIYFLNSFTTSTEYSAREGGRCGGQGLESKVEKKIKGILSNIYIYGMPRLLVFCSTKVINYRTLLFSWLVYRYETLVPPVAVILGLFVR